MRGSAAIPRNMIDNSIKTWYDGRRSQVKGRICFSFHRIARLSASCRCGAKRDARRLVCRRMLDTCARYECRKETKVAESERRSGTFRSLLCRRGAGAGPYAASESRESESRASESRSRVMDGFNAKGSDA